MESRKYESPFSADLFDKVRASDLKKGVDYCLTGDYWPCGGSVVRLKKTVQAKDILHGTKGIATIVCDDAGNEFFVGAKSYLFVKKC